MTGSPPPEPAEPSERQSGADADPEPATGAASEAERRRRRARVFGEVLPDTTQDERPEAPDDGPRGSSSDEWLRRQVPPHHG